ncbi:MAG: NifB/NifX family molybdenum-iron cluster-binding protein [Lentimicrobiaceae bacterium]|jgi:predicted Fe-Mo cluster-binding NifX family protein|nr:NifB/NifX family molybdenum-iron cluster-binding protein [Lentimicrobiaceae bacterium]MDD4599080.1 NifB/NifX family molybdenum-iron cluster-binding protein [Lentimicrobiaceae bacterium]MDY0026807.1 NifB/NifX family molybdenum-iron cluster-binding protein [Lentimicrobium sp.]HAH59817.1 dinitrogenase iron-molybdenum cofactor biosynthesis protein [Bacteroidales bacterium]
MKIAFTAAGTNWDSMIDPRFGRTEYIVIHDENSEELIAIDNSAVKNEAHGAGTATSQRIFELKPDVLITGNGPGDTAAKALAHMKMKIFVGAQDMTLKQAYEKYKSGELKEV